MTFWDIRKGLTFVAKGKRKQVYLVFGFKNHDTVILEKIGMVKGRLEVKRADVPGYISQILEVPNA